jgi:hypothetical protein
MISALRNSHAVDTVSRKPNGDIIARKGFFYRNNKSANDFEQNVRKVLDAAGFTDQYHVVESGEIWKAFKGGASVANQSHWFTIIRERQ